MVWKSGNSDDITDYMSDSEKVAYNYILKVYKPEHIGFDDKGSPDFTTVKKDKVRSWEIKKLYGKKLIFTEKQKKCMVDRYINLKLSGADIRDDINKMIF